MSSVSPEVLNREVSDSTEVTGGVDRRSPERHVVVIQTNVVSIVGHPVVVVPNKQTGEEVEIQTLEDDGRHIEVHLNKRVRRPHYIIS